MPDKSAELHQRCMRGEFSLSLWWVFEALRVDPRMTNRAIQTALVAAGWNRSTRQIRRILRKLEQAGFIEVRGRT